MLKDANRNAQPYRSIQTPVEQLNGQSYDLASSYKIVLGKLSVLLYNEQHAETVLRSISIKVNCSDWFKKLPVNHRQIDLHFVT